METITYYLFGEQAINLFENKDFNQIKNVDFETFKFVGGETHSSDLLLLFSGYEKFSIITKELFDELNSISETSKIVKFSKQQKQFIIDCVDHYREHLINDSADSEKNHDKISDLTHIITLLK